VVTRDVRGILRSRVGEVNALRCGPEARSQGRQGVCRSQRGDRGAGRGLHRASRGPWPAVPQSRCGGALTAIEARVTREPPALCGCSDLGGQPTPRPPLPRRSAGRCDGAFRQLDDPAV